MSEQWGFVKNFARYTVSDLGRVKSIDTDLVVPMTRTPGGVILVRLVDDFGLKTTKKVARLVCDAFLSTGNQYSQVIYKDGDKTNCRLTNLMLIDDPDAPGPSPKVKKIVTIRAPKKSLYVGLEDEEEDNFQPLKATVVSSALVKRKSARKLDLEVKPQGKPQVKKQVETQERRYSRVRVVQTGQEFESIMAMSRALALDPSTVSKMLRGIGRNKTHRGFTFEYAPDSDVVTQKTTHILVQQTGKIYSSISKLAKELNIDRSAVSKVLKKKKGWVTCKGYTFTYVFPDGVKPESLQPMRDYMTRRKRPIRIIETGEVFESQAAAAKHLDIYQTRISAYLLNKSKGPVHGYTFEYADEEKE